MCQFLVRDIILNGFPLNLLVLSGKVTQGTLLQNEKDIN